MRLRVHALFHDSRVNGPGLRSVVHTQGCSLACPGCFNPLSHAHAGGTWVEVDALLELLLARRSDGVTISGGEPSEQLEPVTTLCAALKAANRSVLMFSGRTIEELTGLPGGPTLLRHLDVLVDGRYNAGLATSQGLRGSSNQRIHLLSPRYRPQDLSLHDVEIALLPDGAVRISGFPSHALARGLRHALAGPGPAQ